MLAKTVDIFCLGCGLYGKEFAFFETLIRSTEHPYRLFFQDNRKGTLNMAKLWNEFVANSTSDILVIADSDIQFSPKWLTKFIHIFSNWDVGAVVPVTNVTKEHVHQAACSSGKAPFQVLYGQVSGMCFAFRREAYAEVGKFDEDFGFYGQDSDWFIRSALTTNWEVWVHPGVFVHHSGGASRNMYESTYDFEADKVRALDLFRKKQLKYREIYSQNLKEQLQG